MAKAFAYKALYTPKEMWSIESYNEWFPNKKQWARKVTKFLQIFKNKKTPKTFERKWSRLYR